MRIHHSIINVRFINIDKSYILVSFVLKASPYHSVCHSGIHRTEPSVGQTLESFHWRNPLRVLTIVDHVASFPSKKIPPTFYETQLLWLYVSFVT